MMARIMNLWKKINYALTIHFEWDDKDIFIPGWFVLYMTLLMVIVFAIEIAISLFGVRI